MNGLRSLGDIINALQWMALEGGAIHLHMIMVARSSRLRY